MLIYHKLHLAFLLSTWTIATQTRAVVGARDLVSNYPCLFVKWGVYGIDKTQRPAYYNLIGVLRCVLVVTNWKRLIILCTLRWLVENLGVDMDRHKIAVDLEIKYQTTACGTSMQIYGAYATSNQSIPVFNYNNTHWTECVVERSHILQPMTDNSLKCPEITDK